MYNRLGGTRSVCLNWTYFYMSLYALLEQLFEKAYHTNWYIKSIQNNEKASKKFTDTTPEATATQLVLCRIFEAGIKGPAPICRWWHMVKIGDEKPEEVQTKRWWQKSAPQPRNKPSYISFAEKRYGAMPWNDESYVF